MFQIISISYVMSFFEIKAYNDQRFRGTRIIDYTDNYKTIILQSTIAEIKKYIQYACAGCFVRKT